MIITPNSSKSLNNKRFKKDNISIMNNDSPNSNHFLRLPKQNKNMMCLSPQSNRRFNYRSTCNVTQSNNISIMQKNNIQDQIEQYKLHPFRRWNLKLIGEDIKQKLIEMNEENGGDNEKTISSPTEGRQFSRIVQKNYAHKIHLCA